MRGLEGKHALVTGGGGAIGRAIALRLAAEGASIGVLDRDAPAAEATVLAIREAGGEGHAAAVDLRDYDAVARAVADAEAAQGPTDVLVSAAGWDRVSTFLDSGPELWDEVIAINYRAMLNVHHVVLAGMVERGSGRVVAIASDAARVGSSGEAVYAGCKAGIVAFAKSVARELARHRIPINVVCPGPTDTPLLRSFFEEGEYGSKMHAALERAIPFRRLGEPDDIAGIVAFLASDDAAFITGQVVSVSGGLTMHG